MATGSGQQRGRATRADIVNVARRLFSEHGYHQTGISDIQSATGLTKGAFYHHFRSKEEVALAVLEAAREDYEREWLQPGLQHAAPGARVSALLDGLAALNCRPEWCNCQMLATLCGGLTGNNERLREGVQRMQNNLYDVWQRNIGEAQQSGEADSSIDAGIWAQWIVNTLSGALLAQKLGSTRTDLPRLFAAVKHLLLRQPFDAAAGQPHGVAQARHDSAQSPVEVS